MPNLPGPQLETFRPGQCLLVANADMLVILSPNMWLDNLYLRALFANVPLGEEQLRSKTSITLAGAPPIADNPAISVARYMTRMTFQVSWHHFVS